MRTGEHVKEQHREMSDSDSVLHPSGLSSGTYPGVGSDRKPLWFRVVKTVVRLLLFRYLQR